MEKSASMVSGEWGRDHVQFASMDFRKADN